MANETAGEIRRRRGRPAWVPPNLRQVRALAGQGMTLDRIADALGIARSTLFKKKRELMDFADAIKRGAAEGEVIATNKLFEALKQGKPWAVCFYLKTRCGWRENDVSGANVNVNVNGGFGASDDEQRRREEQEELIRLLSSEERRIYLALMDRAARRQRGEEVVTELKALPLMDLEGLEPLEDDADPPERDSIFPSNPEPSNADVNGSLSPAPPAQAICPRCGRQPAPGEEATFSNGVPIWHRNCR